MISNLKKNAGKLNVLLTIRFTKYNQYCSNKTGKSYTVQKKEKKIEAMHLTYQIHLKIEGIQYFSGTNQKVYVLYPTIQP